MYRIIAAVILALSVVASCVAQAVPPGYDAASFARVGMGVRAQAMGGAFCAIAQGPTGGYWNPAGLAYLQGFQAEGMYTDWLGAGIDIQYISLAGYPPIGEKRPTILLKGRPVKFAATWVSVRVADIPWWEEGGYGTFDAWSHLVIGTCAWELSQNPSVSIGANVEFYHDSILEGKSFGLGWDVGVLWHTQLFDFPASLAFVTTDVGDSKIKWYGTTGEPVNYVPWLARFGLSIETWERQALVGFSYEWGVRRPRFERLRAGLELTFGWLALRAGYDWLLVEPGGRWTAGVGISPWDWLTIDCAFLPGGLGDTYLIAFQMRF